MKNKKMIIASGIIAIITAISMYYGNQNKVLEILRVIFGSIFILFLPGYFLTISFFDKNEIDFLERFALSFALSISVVPLLSFYLNLVGVKINELSVFVIVLLIIIGNIVYINFFKNNKGKIA